VLRLQRMAGNRATTWLLRKGRTTVEFDYSKPKTKGNKPGGWFRKQPRQAEEEKKQKGLDRPKFKTEWLIKEAGGYGGGEGDVKSIDAVKEVFASNLFAELAGSQYSGKARLIKGGKVTGLNSLYPPTRWVGSKAVPGFKSWADVKESGEYPEFEGAVPGLARTLFVGLFLGEGDWNNDNWGFGPGAKGTEIRRVDITGFDFGASVAVANLLTPKGLLDAARWLPFTPEHVDEAELEAVIREVVETGPAAIKRVGEPLRPEFEELDAGEHYESYVAQLLERHKDLCSLVAKS
jgi:hypothetical protein